MKLNSDRIPKVSMPERFEPLLEHDITESIIEGRPIKKRPQATLSGYDKNKLNVQNPN